jgi:DNA mismatch repair protein MutL
MIRKLPPELIREIAAGEVVSAPVDAVRELLDNALDAGATRLEVTLEAGGTKRISVTDNGVGIPREELPLAIEQHSTSKLTTLSSIETLGFRGEGLYALRHAAQLSITSRPASQLGGSTLSVSGDSHTLHDHPAPLGTTVTLTQLFDALPARRAALDHPAEELRKIIQLLSHYLLHYPQLKVRLTHDGEVRWQYAGGTALEAARFIWGTVTANRLFAVQHSSPDIDITGVISRPELSRPKRDRLLLAINQRPVQWEERWLKAILQPYGQLLPHGHYPVGILNIQLPSHTVLVNTSPDKRRVKLLDEMPVLEAIAATLQATLAQHTLAPALPTLHTPEGITPAPQHSFPSLRYLGVYRDLYLLAEAEDTLWVIDQHAAHERILFEWLTRRYQNEPPCELPHPELISLSPEEGATYQANQQALHSIGIVLEPFGGESWRIRSLPAFLLNYPVLQPESVKGALLYPDAHEAWRKVLARLACLPAIKAGHQLTLTDAQQLLNDLQRCQTPWVCPHGRPTALILSELELARRFGRRHARATLPFLEERKET